MERLRITIGLVLAALLLPLVLLSAPFLLLWARAQVRTRARYGHRVLWPFMRRTIVAYAEAWISDRPPPGGWDACVANVDRYLAGIDSPRAWQQSFFIAVMELAPLFTLRRPFSRLPLATRRFLLSRHYVVPGALLAPLGWSRQTVRLGYHAIPDVARESGFIAFEVWSAAAKAERETQGAPGAVPASGNGSAQHAEAASA